MSTRTLRPSRSAPTLLLSALALAGAAWLAGAPLAARAAPAAERPALPSITVQAAGRGQATAFDGVVEAVRQTAVAAQVMGAVVELKVKAGDRVQAGQVLLRLDARAAEQGAAASNAQVVAARAALEVANKDFQRQQKLFADRFISQAALDRAEAEFKATQAQLNAQIAGAGAARTQSGFYVVTAPYAGVVAEVPVVLGDMAAPGRVLVSLYDPAALRVSAAVPQSALAGQASPALKLELPGLPAARQWLQPARVQVLPVADAATHSVTVRADLPAGTDAAALPPGSFARLWLQAAVAGSDAAAPISIPASAVVRRAEMTGVYVLSAQGQPLLRQVRLGRSDGQQVQVLTGLSAGERLVTDPAAAARLR
jgi:RND family efflux transporter MFP subunit